jgi:hypothetical protein
LAKNNFRVALDLSATHAAKIKRSQCSSTMGKVIFALDARIGLNAEEWSLVKKYRLGGFVVYDSKAREKYREATKGHLEMTREHAPLKNWSAEMIIDTAVFLTARSDFKY